MAALMTVRLRRVGILGATLPLVQSPDEVGIVVGTQRTRGAGARWRVAAPAGNTAALDHPDQKVDRDGDQQDDQYELAHGPTLSPVWLTGPTLAGVKEFVIYTALRLLLFVVSFLVVIGVWLGLTDSVPLLWALLISLAVSGVASYFLLRGPREAFARVVDRRAGRATAAYERMKAKEDAD